MRRSIAVVVALLAAPVAHGAEVIRVYGPGGPAPAMKEAAEAYGKAKGVQVEVTAGPTDGWIAKAREDADVVYSGAEYMMTDLVRLMNGQLEERDVQTLYLRPSAILVRPGNPKGIRDLPDLVRPGVKVLVVQGAGQTGMWEDMAGRTGDVAMVRALRRNIQVHAPNTGEAKKIWTQRADLDAWIVFNIWQVANPKLADLVPVSQKYVVYRSAGAALTQRGREKTEATGFVSFLRSDEGARIFARWGWVTGARASARTPGRR
jgi:accessory colonization factor AcfC